MIDFSDDFVNIFTGLQALQNHLDTEFQILNNRIQILEEKQNKDDVFFNDLERLIKTRNGN